MAGTAEVLSTDPNALAQQIGGMFNDLGTADNAVQNPVDVYNAALDKLGISDARTRVQGLRTNLFNTESLLRALPGDVQGRTQDFNVSQAQRDKLTASESAPLSDQVNTMSRALEGAQGDYQDVLGEGKTQADLTFQGQQQARQNLMDRLKIAIDQSNDMEQKREWQAELDKQEADAAEAAREFNANLALEQSKAAAAARSGGSSSAAKQPSYQQRSSDKGFNFQDASGNPISARSYAALTGTNFNALIQQMANAGDAGAKDFLKNGTASKYATALGWG